MADEPGCLRLDILRIVGEDGKTLPHKFIVYEIFENKAAYEYHGQQPWSKDVGKFVQSGGIAHEDAYVAESLFLTDLKTT